MRAFGRTKLRPDKVAMHFNFDFSASQILWTLTFAALLVLLVVLLGRDRARRFPWFTASIAMMGLLMLTTQCMLAKMSRITGTVTFLALSDLDVVIALMVVVELARHAFRGVGQLGWTTGTLAMLGVAAAVAPFGDRGPVEDGDRHIGACDDPADRYDRGQGQPIHRRADDRAGSAGDPVWKTLRRRMAQPYATDRDRTVNGLARANDAARSAGGNRKHTQIHTQAEYDRVVDLRDKLIHANNVMYLCVMMWWIACLWVDEPGPHSGGGRSACASRTRRRGE